MKSFLKAAMLWGWRIVTVPLVLPVAIILLMANEDGDMADRFANWIWFIKKH